MCAFMIVSCNKDGIVIKYRWPRDTVGDSVCECNERKGFVLAANVLIAAGNEYAKFT